MQMAAKACVCPFFSNKELFTPYSLFYFMLWIGVFYTTTYNQIYDGKAYGTVICNAQ